MTALSGGTAAELRIEHAGKRFGSTIAMDDVTFTVEAGRLACLLGPSGCGKTTVLRVVAGLERPDAGRVVLAGRDITMLPPAKRRLGMVFQSYALFPNLSVHDNVAYGLRGKGLPSARVDARVRELLELVGLDYAAARFPAQLSGGQQQRVALARALVLSPDVLLLDEPLSALDAKVRVRLRGEIRALQQRLGITTIIVTHDQEEALTMADTVVVMNSGVVEQVGSPREVYDRPISAFVADFIGSVNFLDAADLDVVTTLMPGCAGDVRAESAVGGVLGIRPEHIQVTSRPLTIDDGCHATIRARLESVEFCGSFFRLTAHALLGSAGREYAVTVTSPAGSNGLEALDSGQDVWLHVPWERVLHFPRVAASEPSQEVRAVA